jgi:hypothetical protein
MIPGGSMSAQNDSLWQKITSEPGSAARAADTSCRCTLEIYSQARLQAKREAQHRVVELIIPREREVTETEWPLILANGKAARTALL